MASAIAAGKAEAFVDKDGVTYYAWNNQVFGAREKGKGTDFFPVSGDNMVFLGGARSEAIEQAMADIAKGIHEKVVIKHVSEMFGITQDETSEILNLLRGKNDSIRFHKEKN